MASTSNCIAPIKGTHYRMIKLDVCGNPVTGTSSLVVVSKGFTQVTMDPQYEDGVEFFERTADGTVCVNQKDPPTLKRMQLTINLCEVNVSASAYMMSVRELVTGSTTTGTGFAVAEGQPLNHFSFEVWQQVAGSGACDASGLQRYIYNAWPNVMNAQIGNYVVENGRSTLSLIAETQGAGTLWGDGPGTGTGWLPTGTGNNGTALTTDHWLWNMSTNAPPTAACNPSTLT